MRLSGMRKFIVPDKIHWEETRGTPDQNVHYCSKPHKGCLCEHCVEARKCGMRDDHDWFEVGERSTHKQGKRRDLSEFVDDVIINKKRKRDMIEDREHLMTLAKYPRFCDEVILATGRKREAPPEVTLLLGPPGVGKSRYVEEQYDELDVWPWTNGEWFTGYSGHPVAFFDEFEGKMSKMSQALMNRVLDRYPFLAPTKGLFTWWEPKTIIIASNLHPFTWWSWARREVKYASLYRRISRVVTWNSSGTECTMLSNPASVDGVAEREHALELWNLFFDEIGRASCRERV